MQLQQLFEPEKPAQKGKRHAEMKSFEKYTSKIILITEAK